MRSRHRVGPGHGNYAIPVGSGASHRVRQHVDRYATLTPREREVLRVMVKGRLNKQIAFDLGISEITVKLHRGNATRKLRAGVRRPVDPDMGITARGNLEGSNLPRQQLRTHELASKVRQQTVGGLEICRLHTFNESLEYGL
jgi:DNA-binding CsgD family transcriptional regulator